MAGSLWRQEIGSDRAVELTHGPGYDYQPDWSPDGRHIVFARHRQQRDRAVAARRVVRQGAAAHDDGCREPRAALLARRQAARLRVDGRQRSFQSVRRTDRSRQARYAARCRRAAREQDRALLLFEARSHDQSVVDAGRQAAGVRLQSRDRVRHRRPVQRRGRWRKRVRMLRARRNQLARAAGSRAGRPARAVQQLPGTSVASAVVDDARRRCAVAADVRRFRCDAGALVAGRTTHRVHQQRRRQFARCGCIEVVGGERMRIVDARTASTRVRWRQLRIRAEDAAGQTRARAHQRRRRGQSLLRRRTIAGCTPTMVSIRVRLPSECAISIVRANAR